MNPLDKEELKAFLQIIKKDMPIHTDDTVKIKRSYSQGMPKNLMDYSEKIDNKFLNDNLHTIEEMEFKKKGITNDFKNYQNKYYDKSGILNHDLYFEHENKIYSKVSGSGVLINPYNFVIAHVNGSDITSGGTANHGASWGGGYIWVSHSNTTGTIGHFYDRIAVNEFTASGNKRLATYTNLSLLPNTLLSETGSNTSSTGFPWVTVTEYALTTAQTWLAYQSDTGSANIYYQNIYGDFLHQYAQYPHSYGTFTNPFVQTSDSNQLINMKIGHS